MPEEDAARDSKPIFSIDPDAIHNREVLMSIYADLDSTLYWSPDWSAEFYVELARLGFICIATDHPEVGAVMIPEMQEAYAVLDWENLHVARKVRPLLRSHDAGERGLDLRIVGNPDQVLDRLVEYHGEDNWLSPQYCDLMRSLAREKRLGFELVAVELWCAEEDRLIAGELGYAIGQTYTSLSGFSNRTERRFRGFGTLQMILLARWLERAGFTFWNMGHPQLAYKQAIGASIVPRLDFLRRWFPAAGQGRSVPPSPPSVA